MNRFPRTSVTLALTALLIATVPAAQARTFADHAPSVSGSWFDAALAWLGDLGLTGAQAARSHQAPATKSTALPPPGELNGGGIHPMGCSTIDPNGGTGATGAGGGLNCHGGA
jgi:hypothetical protein